MSLNEAYKVRSRWPVSFDIEGVPRDTKTRNLKLISIEDPNMKISNVRQKGTFNFNTPENNRYQHEDFPRMIYRGEKNKAVETQDELDAALAKGWFLKKSEAHEAIGIVPPTAVPELPEDEDDEDLPVAETEEEEGDEAIDDEPAAEQSAPKVKKAKAKKKK